MPLLLDIRHVFVCGGSALAAIIAAAVSTECLYRDRRPRSAWPFVVLLSLSLPPPSPIAQIIIPTRHRISPTTSACILPGLGAAREAYCGYCGIPWHSDREAVSSTLVDVVTRASGYPGTRECFHGVKKMTRYCNTRRLMAKHRHR